MALLSAAGREYECLWASDVAFDGIRLEVYDQVGAVFFDLSISEGGKITINTFSNEVPAEIVLAAIELASQRA